MQPTVPPNNTVQVDRDKLIEFRTRKNWTQEKLADKAIVSVRTVQNLERGRPTQRSTLAKLADALCVSPGDLILAANHVSPRTTPSRLAVPISVSRRPYRGLSAFMEEDAKFFFGRDRVVTSLLDKLKRNKLLQISGPSGSGKSSVVSAGLIPELRRSARVAILSCRPGADLFASVATALIPFMERAPKDQPDQQAELLTLVRALEGGELPFLLQRIARKAGSVLLFIDQFEELFAFGHEDQTRCRFLDSLVRAANSQLIWPNSELKIVCAIRSDWACRLISYRGFTNLTQDADVKLGPLTGSEIRQAIEQPALLCGVRFEAGLVQRLVADAGEESGMLPLLQFALAQLWEHQTAGLITHASYDEIGQLSGAISNHGEAVFRSLSSKQQELAREILTKLVHLAAGEIHRRRRLPLGALYAHDSLNTDEGRHVLHTLIEARLLTSGREQDLREDTVELAHEAVIHRWPRFRQWLEEDRDLLAWRERFGCLVDAWQRSGRDDRFLLQGPLLDEARLWLARRGRDLSLTERQLIEGNHIRRQMERWSQPVRSIDLLIEASNDDLRGPGSRPSTRADSATGRFWRLQAQLFAVPVAQERDLASRLPQISATDALALFAGKPSPRLDIRNNSEFIEDAGDARDVDSATLRFLAYLQGRGASGQALELIAPRLDSIHDTTLRLRLASIVFDMMHLRGRYEDAATLIEQELAFHASADAQLAPLLLSLRIRLLHHQMFFRSVDYVWSAMLELLSQLDSTSDSYGEVLFMLGGNLGALRGHYREARRFLVRALRYARRNGDDYLLSRCLRKYGDYLRFRGHLRFAMAAFREARRLAQRGGGTRQRIYATGCLADLERQRGNFTAARELFEETLRCAKQAFIPGWMGNAYLGMAELAFVTKKLQEAEIFMEQAECHYRSTRPGHLWGEIQVGLLRGKLLRTTGRFEWREVLEGTRRRASAVGYRRDVAQLRQALEHRSKIANPLMFL